MTVLKDALSTLGPRKAFFIHNWRCGGSSLNSIFSSNFGSHYCKIGTQFTSFGWPNYKVKELLTLTDVRSRSDQTSILGGHLCFGIETLIGGPWDLWINARQPIDRLASGILRFHSKQFTIKDGKYSASAAKSYSESILEKLINGPLRHEQNGVAKRLAGFSYADSFDISGDINLEELSCYSCDSNDSQLLNVALRNLRLVKLVFVPNALHASILCMERLYSLGPQLNLFSDLRHNSVGLGKSSPDQRRLFDLSRNLLSKLCAVDMALWREIERKFIQQLQIFKVTKKEIMLRELLHQNSFFTSHIIEASGSDSEMIRRIVSRIVELSVANPGYGNSIASLVVSWQRFNRDAAEEILSQANFALEEKGLLD